MAMPARISTVVIDARPGFRSTVLALLTVLGVLGPRALPAHRLACVERVLPDCRPGHRWPGRQAPIGTGNKYVSNGAPIPAECQRATRYGSIPQCLAAHGYGGYLTYQPANRFWAF